jgi:predicted Fe-Mo cluster-binding NifX family protein
MTKSAFAHWNARIAPVFDVARQVRLVEADAGRIAAEAEEVFPDDLPAHKAVRLAELGVRTLVCGAVSRPAHDLLLAYGIDVIPFVTGDLQEVIHAWLRGEVTRRVYSMPGCGGRGRRHRRGVAGAEREATNMNRPTRGEGMPGGGRGQGRHGQGPGRGRRGNGPGRMGDPMAAGAAGTCVCPACGHREPHQRGLPCVQTTCPACGTAMVRASAE